MRDVEIDERVFRARRALRAKTRVLLLARPRRRGVRGPRAPFPSPRPHRARARVRRATDDGAADQAHGGFRHRGRRGRDGRRVARLRAGGDEGVGMGSPDPVFLTPHGGGGGGAGSLNSSDSAIGSADNTRGVRPRARVRVSRPAIGETPRPPPLPDPVPSPPATPTSARAIAASRFLPRRAPHLPHPPPRSQITEIMRNVRMERHDNRPPPRSGAAPERMRLLRAPPGAARSRPARARAPTPSAPTPPPRPDPSPRPPPTPLPRRPPPSSPRPPPPTRTPPRGRRRSGRAKRRTSPTQRAGDADQPKKRQLHPHTARATGGAESGEGVCVCVCRVARARRVCVIACVCEKSDVHASCVAAASVSSAASSADRAGASSADQPSTRQAQARSARDAAASAARQGASRRSPRGSFLAPSSFRSRRFGRALCS